LQSGNPAASGGLVALELEPAEVELVLLPVLLVLGLVLLPLLVLGVSFRTCFVTLSQHFTLLEDVALDGGVVVVGVCATARPKLPVSIAAAINPIPAIRMRHPSLVGLGWRVFAITEGKRHHAPAVPRPSRDKKRPRHHSGAL